MEKETKSDQTQSDNPEKISYEAPAVEKVLTADELTREVQYAGITRISNGV